MNLTVFTQTGGENRPGPFDAQAALALDTDVDHASLR